MVSRFGMVVRVFTGVLLCGMALGAKGQTQYVDRTVTVDISSETLGAALIDFSKQTGIQVITPGSSVKGLSTLGVHGQMPASAALRRLLEGTALEFHALGPNTIGITAAAKPTAESPPGASANSGVSLVRLSAQSDMRVGEESRGEPKGSQQSASLEEVIVTAQKREERLQDVPVPVTVVNTDLLVGNNQLRLRDFYTSVPGLSVMPSTSGSGGSFQSVAIRGITTGVYTNPTVGIAVDDVPYGSSTAVGAGGGMVVADIDPADLARIEVLRGPQGTLYGASSMGGLIKYITVDPSTEATTGRVEADVNGVSHGAELGYGTRASVNFPLSESLALRASGFTREDPGYIDNVQTGQTGVNEDHVSGGRVAALWRPLPAVSLKISALYQEARGDGFSDVDQPINGYTGPPLGSLDQSRLRGTGQYDRTVQAYSAVLQAKLGAAELTSVSGYNINRYSDTYDLTYFFAPYTQAQFGVTGTPSPERNKTDKFTQEVRLSTPLGEHVDWLLGAFFTHESSQYAQSILAANPSTGGVTGDFYNVAFLPGYTEYAGFTNLTLRFSEHFDIELGARESKIRQSYSEVDTGPFLTGVLGEPSPHIVPETNTRASAFTYLVTPRLKISPDLMVYTRIASGYRPGGPNLTLSPGTPPEYNPDKTQNYEVGVKADFFDHALSIDSSLYYINWKDIQLSLVNAQTGLGYTGNGGEAKSQGVELSVESKPMSGMTVAAWMTLSDAELKETFPSASTAYGAAGDNLPYSSRFSGSLSLHQEFPLTGMLAGFIGGSLSYVGGREGEFTSNATRQALPAFARTDLQAGAKYGAWTVNFFVNNLADKRGVLAGGLGSYPPFAFQFIQPRVVGLSVVRTF